MANEILGHVTCPFCNNTAATVHREARGKKSLYYRCYKTDSDDYCGTVQIRYATGQRWIIENMRPLTLLEQDKAIEAAAHDAAENTRAAVKATRKSFFASLVDSEGA